MEMTEIVFEKKFLREKISYSCRSIDVSKSICPQTKLLGVCQVPLYEPLNGTSLVLLIYCQFPFSTTQHAILFTSICLIFILRHIKIFDLNFYLSLSLLNAMRFCNCANSLPIFCLKLQKYFRFISTQSN